MILVQTDHRFGVGVAIWSISELRPRWRSRRDVLIEPEEVGGVVTSLESTQASEPFVTVGSRQLDALNLGHEVHIVA